MTAQRSVHRLAALLGMMLLLAVLPASRASAKVINPAVTVAWGGQGSAGPVFSSPRGVDVDSAGNGYVADTDLDRIVKVSPAGAVLAAWGSEGTGNGQFSQPEDVAVDGSGNIFVADTGNNRIQVLDSAGAYVRQWGGTGTADGQFDLPLSVDVDAGGDVYVTDFMNQRVQKFSSTGTFILKWGTPGTGDGQFQRPWSIAVGPANTVFVTDGPTIQKFSTAGVFKARFGAYGDSGPGDGLFDTATGVAVDGSGDVYVSDYAYNTVQKFSASGAFIQRLSVWGSAAGQLDSPFGLATDAAGNLYVADSFNNRIQKFDSALQPLGLWAQPGSGTGAFGRIEDVGLTTSGDIIVTEFQGTLRRFDSAGTFEAKWYMGPGDIQRIAGSVAVDASGNIYVADWGNNLIQKFDADGVPLTQWGSEGGAPGQFSNPGGLAIGPGPFLYVVDRGNNRIQKFTLAGTFVDEWGTFEADNGQLNNPVDLAFGPSGNVFVSDAYNNRIVEITTDGTFVASWGVNGRGPGQFKRPWHLAFDPAGYLYVSDKPSDGLARIQRFTADGEYVGGWSNPAGYYCYDGGCDAEYVGGFTIDGGFGAYVPYRTSHDRYVRYYTPFTALRISAPKTVLKGAKATIKGSLDASHFECFDSATVALMKGTSQLQTTKTSASGAYKFSLKFTKKTTVHVEFAGSTFETTGTCPPATSVNKTIKPT